MYGKFSLEAREKIEYCSFSVFDFLLLQNITTYINIKADKKLFEIYHSSAVTGDFPERIGWILDRQNSNANYQKNIKFLCCIWS